MEVGAAKAAALHGNALQEKKANGWPGSSLNAAQVTKATIEAMAKTAATTISPP